MTERTNGISEGEPSDDTENRIEQLEAENRELRERLDEIEVTLSQPLSSEELEALQDESDEQSGSLGITRRGALAALAGAGVLGVAGTGTASADVSNDDIIGASYSGEGAFEVTNTTTGDEFAFGIRGITHANLGRGLAGFAREGEGSIALFGRNESNVGGTGIRGICDAEEGFSRGIFGSVDSPGGTGIFATNTATTGNAFGCVALSNSDEGVALRARNQADSGETAAIEAIADSPDGVGLWTPNNIEVEGDILSTNGNLEIDGTKHFVQAVETPAGPKEVVYTSVEAGRPHTETSAVAEMKDGRAVVDLPDHFSLVTNDEEPLVVQVTPYTDEKAHPQVVERSTDRIVVEDLEAESADYSFAYTVKGVRDGFEDREVIRDP